MRDDISDLIMLFKNRGNRIFDMMVALHEFYLFLENLCSEIADILDLFLEIH